MKILDYLSKLNIDDRLNDDISHYFDELKFYECIIDIITYHITYIIPEKLIICVIHNTPSDVRYLICETETFNLTMQKMFNEKSHKVLMTPIISINKKRKYYYKTINNSKQIWIGSRNKQKEFKEFLDKIIKIEHRNYMLKTLLND